MGFLTRSFAAPWFQSIFFASFLDCTDPKDKVFALLVLTPSLRSIPFSYDSSVAEIYMSVTLAAIHEARSLAILTYASCRLHPELPISWMFNFESEVDVRWEPSSTFHDLSDAAAGATLCTEKTGTYYLRLRGLRMDQITEFGPTWTGNRASSSSGPDEKAEEGSLAELNIGELIKFTVILQKWSDFLQTPRDEYWNTVFCGALDSSIEADGTDAPPRRLTADDCERLSTLLETIQHSQGTSPQNNADPCRLAKVDQPD